MNGDYKPAALFEFAAGKEENTDMFCDTSVNINQEL